MRTLLTSVTTVFLVSGCATEVDYPQRGLFVLSNETGHAVTLRVFKTQDRKRAPLLVEIAKGRRVERELSEDGIAYPELYFQGDSIRLVFDDGKQLLHYCPNALQLARQCNPTRNLLSLDQYRVEPIGKSYDRYTFKLLPADYAAAR